MKKKNSKSPKHSKITSAKKVSKKTSTSFWSTYTQERDAFYRSNPRARVLLGLLVIVTAIAIGLFYHKKQQVYIGLELDKYGVDYPYIEPVKN